MLLKFKKLHPDAVIPKQMTEGAAGMDLTAIDAADGCSTVTYMTGLAVEIPPGYVGLIFPRSSIFKKDISLSNSVGVIDSDYRGEIKAVFRKHYELDDLYKYEIGDRIAQLIIMPIPHFEILEVAELSETQRGEGGYGSTGR